MRYFKVNLGYSEFISIDETELAKCMQAQATGAITFVNGGTISGKYISHITPDIHKALGLNYAYKLEPEDYNQFKQLDNEYREAFTLQLEALKNNTKQLQ